MFWNDTYLCCRIALIQGCLHLERNGETMQTKMQNMKVWERHKLQVHAQKKHLKHAILQKTKKRNGEACKKMQIRPGTNWTNMSSDKIYESKKKKSKAEQMQIRPDKHDFGKTNAKKLGLILKCRKNANCTFAMAFCLHFCCIVVLHSFFFGLFDLVHVFLVFFSRLQFSRRIPQGATAKTPAILKICLGRTLVYGNWWKLWKTHGKRWDLPKLAMPLFNPFQGYVIVCHCISLISTLAIPKLDVDFSESYTKKCSSFLQVILYPPSLPYIIVQTCGKRWDLPKFVDVLSVNLGFSRLLNIICMYIYIYVNGFSI